MLITGARTRVAVLRGGPSNAYDHSLKTGGYVLSLLREMPEAYEPLDIFISRAGEWHKAGLVGEPHKLLSHADVVWNALHGTYGEDGGVQRLLEGLNLPFTGSSTVSSVFATNKEISKTLYRRHNLLTPESEVINENDFNDEQLIEIFRTYFHPVIVKPSNGVRALGVRLAHTFQELKKAVKETFQHSPKVLVEEYVSGTVSSCLVVEGGKGESLYAFLPTGKRNVEENKKITDMAKLAHSALGLRHYSSSDFIVNPKGKIYILETNALPIFHEKSPFNESLKTTGWRPHDFVDHVLNLTI